MPELTRRWAAASCYPKLQSFTTHVDISQVKAPMHLNYQGVPHTHSSNGLDMIIYRYTENIVYLSHFLLSLSPASAISGGSFSPPHLPSSPTTFFTKWPELHCGLDFWSLMSLLLWIIFMLLLLLFDIKNLDNGVLLLQHLRLRPPHLLPTCRCSSLR